MKADGPFTSATLQRFDGNEERPAYFAYKGKVYDATQSKMWREGVHMKRHSAGTDLTTALALAPHAEEVIARLPVVGNYIGDIGSEHTMTAKIFYALAYQNLTFVFIIIFIISLWKWG